MKATQVIHRRLGWHWGEFSLSRQSRHLRPERKVFSEIVFLAPPLGNRTHCVRCA